MELLYKSETQTEHFHGDDFLQIIPCPNLLFSAQIKPEYLALVCIFGRVVPVKNQFGQKAKYLLVAKNYQFAVVLDRLPELIETQTNILPFPTFEKDRSAA